MSFLVPPRVGEGVDMTLPGFADNVRGSIQKVIHAVDAASNPGFMWLLYR
jgi:hypothetical protein